ncbi:hypothetical protein SH449x_001599 [Pirellulaceae bacterium SH449]
MISNRMQVVDNPQLVYRHYAERRESENRNKELKCGLLGDRLSDHRYMADLFRVIMHCLSHKQFVAPRQLLAFPVPAEEIAILNAESVKSVNRSFTETKAERKAHNDADAIGLNLVYCKFLSVISKFIGRRTFSDFKGK